MHVLIESLEHRTHLTVALDTIPAQQFPGGKAMLVPVTGTTDGATQTNYSVSASDPQISASVLSNLTFLRMDISIGGTPRGYLEFALLGDIAPNTIARITELVNSGFYDGLTFHRVIPGFMAQGGDPDGDGSGGSGTTIDDEFSPLAIFNRPYLLAMANSNNGSVCDTNDSQFFVTVAQTRWLDFRHTIFGTLVRGRSVLNQIVAVGSQSGDTSATVLITDASIVQNNADTVLLVQGPNGVSGTISVTATDSNSSATKTFTASAIADTTDDPPFLDPVPNQLTVTGVPLVLSPTATSIDAGTPNLDAIVLSDSASKLTLTKTGDVYTFTPAVGFSGVAGFLVGVQQSSNNWDSQRVNVVVQSPATTSVDTAGHLTITGTTANDVVSLAVVGGDLRVTINGVVKPDIALASITSIQVDLSNGNDTITVGAGVTNLSIYGGTGNDTITGGSAADVIYGGDGHDSIAGMGGADIIHGEAGNDSVYGGPGADTIQLGAGYDLCYSGRDNDSVSGGGQRDTIVGDNNDDRLYGGDDFDVLNGGYGNDRLGGDAGSDQLVGSSGVDIIYGGDGADRIYGGYDGDALYGEAGDDTIQGGLGGDILDGGADRDILLGEDGNDWLYANGDGSKDTLRGDAGDDHARRDTGTIADVLLDTIENLLS